MLAVCVCVHPQFQLLNQLTDLYYTWYGHYAIVGYPNISFISYSQ